MREMAHARQARRAAHGRPLFRRAALYVKSVARVLGQAQLAAEKARQRPPRRRGPGGAVARLAAPRRARLSMESSGAEFNRARPLVALLIMVICTPSPATWPGARRPASATWWPARTAGHRSRVR